jgi:6-oxo-cyclohex-1-ene-carbonyl-CoA hydrolase
MLKDHTLTGSHGFKEIDYQLLPARDPAGNEVAGLFNAWIVLDNPGQLNSYTTDAVKEVILAFRQASMDRSVVAVVFTAVGDKAFCTGLFNDMIDSILRCDKPVINRVNGMRLAGGQEIGMACDFTIAADTARFGQAGPKHGSAPDGGSTDFLPLYVGFSHAMESGVLCEMWSAHKALFIGLINEVVPVLKVDGKWIPNPMVITDKIVDEFGTMVFGNFKTGDGRDAAKAVLAKAETDFTKLDDAVEALCTKILMLMPDCVSKTVNGLRKHKQWHWDNTSVTNREWLALNMMTEAKAGFRAFNEGPKGKREVDFIKLRQMLADGHPWDDELLRAISPQFQNK